VSIRWWLTLAFAAVAALTAVAVAEVFTQRAESSFRSRAQELAAGSAVGAAEAIRPAFATGEVAATTADQASSRRVALFVFDRRRQLISDARSRGVEASRVPAIGSALDHALSGGRYMRTFNRGQTIVVGLPLKGGSAGGLVAVALRPELAAELGIVRTEIVPSALIAVVVGALVGLLIAVLIALRLRGIASAARSIAAGEFETELHPGFADELGDLTETVDRMRIKLREFFLALGGERDRFHRLLEHLHDGVVAVDDEGRVVFANRSGRSILGLGARSERALLPDPWYSLSLYRLALSLFEPGAEPSEQRVTADAEHAYTVAGIPPPQGLPVAVLVLRDVTERERRERAEREFVANAAHELRTPITAISGAVEALESGAKDDAAARDRFLSIVGRQSARLGRLVRALLVLARAQIDQESLPLEPVELEPLLADVIATVAATEPQVKLDCPAGLSVVAHRDLLEQAIANLLVNAVRYANGAPVLISARYVGDGLTEIEVSDSGPGIDPLDRDRVFDRFYTRDRARPGERFGLGLPIVREAVRALGGTIALQSETGMGTTVRIALPAVAEVGYA
jgi:PAS domain S-box-containing protein